MAAPATTNATQELQDAVTRIERESVSVTEAASRCGLSYMTMRRRIEAGAVPAFHVAGHARVWVVDLP